MRTLLMTSTLLVALAATPVLAAVPSNDISPVTGQPEPFSRSASNIAPSNTRSEIAPSLPAPQAEGPRNLLMTASQDLGSGQTGAAQEALERAETRILDRSVPATMASQPDGSQAVSIIRQALMAVAQHDLQGANTYIQQALQALPPDGQSSAMIGQPAYQGSITTTP